MDLDDEELRATRILNGTNKKLADEMFEELGYTVSNGKWEEHLKRLLKK